MSSRRLLIPWLILALTALALPALAANHLYAVSTGQLARVDLVARDADRLTVRVALPELQWGDTAAGGETWDVVAVENLGTTSQVGAPMLPVLTRLVAVEAAEGISARLANRDVETIAGVRVLPFQPKMDRSATETPPFAIDEEIYAYDQWWPSQTLVAGEPVIIHGRRFVPVHYYPVQYNPVRESIRVNRAADLTITGGKPSAVNRLTRALPPSMAFQGLVEDWTWSFDRKSDPQTNWAPQDGAILVIVADQFLAGAQPYIDWKVRKGLPVEVWKTSELNGAGQDAQALKQALYDRYHDATLPPLDYVLLVGDFEHITTMFGIGGCSSDSKFVTLDGADYFPDTIIGRLSIKNVQQLANAVNKMVNYESKPNLTDTSWYLKGLTVSSSESQDDQNAAFVANILRDEAGFTKVDSYYQSNGQATRPNVNAALNEGRSWLAYFGHGAATSWSSITPVYNNQDVIALANTDKLPVITDIACDNAHFDMDADCFAEVWIKNSEHTGAAGIFAASRNTPFGWTDQLGRGVAVGHFRKGFLTFGAASYLGKMYMYHVYPESAGGTTEEVMQHYLIFGDPELNIWSDAPILPTVELPAQIEEGDAGPFEIEVAVNGAPLAGALVHVWREDEWDFAARTDTDGVVEFAPDSSLGLGSLQVLITGRNALPYEGQIAIVPASGDDDDAVDDDVSDDDTADDDAADDDAADDDAADDDDDDDDNDSGGCA